MIFSEKTYQILKWACLIAAPAIATFLTTILPLFGVSAEMVNVACAVVTAATTLVGTLIGISNHNYYKEEGDED